MIFGIVCLLMIGAIAYFHYVQGLFSATLSAICAIFAAVVALGIQEQIIAKYLGGKFADFATGMVLVGLFAVIYIGLRTVFDKLVPGNLRMPLMVDRIGAGVMGFIAGMFGVGVLAIAAQSLPFGPSVAGFSRYELADSRGVVAAIPGMRNMQDLQVFDEVKEPTLDDAKSSGMLIPVDALVVGTTRKLSDGGALAGQTAFSSVHPDYLNELFGQRIGFQQGAKRVAVASAGKTPGTLGGVATFASLKQLDAEIPSIRGDAMAIVKSPTYKPEGDRILVVVRISLDADLGDKDSKVRLSPGSVRLVGLHEGSGGAAAAVNYYPIGTLGKDGTLFRNRIGDPLAANTGAPIDFVFDVDKADLLGPKDPKAGGETIAPGIFIEVKRMLRLDLGGQAIAPLKAAEDAVFRKPQPVKK